MAYVTDDPLGPVDKLICHLVAAADWAAGGGDATGYRPASLDSEGFVHFSTPAQVVETANLFYPGRDDLLLLVVDPSRLRGELRWEAPAGATHRDGQLFPHLYAQIDADAVIVVHPFPPPSGGQFTGLPEPLVPSVPSVPSVSGVSGGPTSPGVSASDG